MTSHTLLVAGAVSYDYLVFPMTYLANADHHATPNDGDEASHLVIRTSEADLVAQLLTAAAPTWGFQVASPVLQPAGSNCLKHNASAVVDLEQSDPSSGQRSPFRVVRKRQIGKPPIWHSPAIDQTSAAKASTVIISGSGEALHDVEPALDFLQRIRPRYIIHHMTRPLARGHLWDLIRGAYV